MRRISLLALVVSASLLGVLVIGSASASATVLCKQAAAGNQCAPEDLYAEGTKVQAELAPGTYASISTLSGGYINSCSSAKIGTTIGGQSKEGTLEASLDEYTFGGCKYQLNVLPAIQAAYFNWTPGTHAGQVTLLNTVETNFGVMGPKTMCYYVIAGPAKVVPGSTPQLVFGEDSYGYEAKGQSFLCPKKVKFTATYNITTPSPLYVEQN